ncbi:hypothetical protein [Bosea vaviloviae]|uniref:SPOR domain-containing protein n=1 Tax=Bosea vaviloviae TaxID=1526658 RepID=A0A1D7U4C3_9HYPH|nr:hypothetical protein [Bosea vaviloviae]AOO82228.1 hypothetical protein BHK69_18860 [Bosea vaviloviae]
MSTATKWFFGYRLAGTSAQQPGAWVACGPFDGYDKAMADRKMMKAADAEVTTPFQSTSKEEARKTL